MTTFRLLVLSLLACLSMPARVAAFELGMARVSAAAGASVCRDAQGGEARDTGLAVESLGDDEPDDDDDAGDDADAAPVFGVGERPVGVSGAVFGWIPGLRAAFGVRGNLFRPPRVAG